MTDITKTYETVDGVEFTITYRKTVLGDVRLRVLTGRYATDDLPDADLRFDFAWLMAFVVKVEGLKVKPPTEHATAEDFEKAYHAFAFLVDGDTWKQMAADVHELRLPTTDAVEKPDDALTEEEQTDPN